MNIAAEYDNELVPLGVRLRWMLLGRVVLIALVPLGLVVDGADRAATRTLMAVALGWFLLTVPALLAPRIGQAVTRFTFNATMLGDGLLLCLLWWVLGGLTGVGGHLVWLHCAAATLLASFRTGLKMAVWQCLLALVVVEAAAAGVLGPPTGFDVTDLVVHQASLLGTVLATAAFAAVTERELRRRLADGDVLRRLAGELAHEREVDEIAGMLGDFAVRRLRAPHAAVLMWPVAATGSAVVTTADGTQTHPDTTAAPPDTSIVADALSDGRTRYLTRLSATGDHRLAGLLPGARNLIVVPFVLNQLSGALVMAAPRSRDGRVERRIGDTAEQATALAAGALGRAVLTDMVRAHTRDRQYVA